MEHFYHKIQGWFNYSDIVDYVVDLLPDGGHMVEIGVWKGASSAYTGVAIINSGKNIKFDAIDTWLGSPELADYEEIKNGNLYEVFLENIKPVAHVVNPVRLPSIEAAALYADNSLDYVFIDGEHSYEAVYADINAWKPKLKSPGILAGHDIDHPPVRRAVEELIPNYRVWGASWCVLT